MKNQIVKIDDVIESRILWIRNEKVMLDTDLAKLYGVTTKALNQAIRRNLSRFPSDFMYQLSKDEKTEVVTNCDHLRSLKFSTKLPYAFTEQGVAMLSSVLRSEKAVKVNIEIMRAFVKLRKLLATHSDLARKLAQLEAKYDKQFAVVFEAIRALMSDDHDKKSPYSPGKKRIGFSTNEK